MKWEKVKLSDVCIKIGSGATPKGGSTVYIEKGTAFIRSQNVYNLYFDFSGLVFINEEAAKKLNGVTIEKNDVLLNITGDSVARTCLAPEELLPARVNQHVAIVRPDKNILNPIFLNYYLAGPDMQSRMLGLAVGKGASRNAMTKEMIASFKVPCPSLDIQNKIVNILKPYDDLIENNQKQIKLLEEAAQRLYKEWFVDFRFPGYENAKFIDGIPEGWRKEPVCNIVSYEIGGGWGEDYLKEQNDKPAFVIRGTDLHGITHGDILSIPYRYHTQSNLASRILQDGDIVFEVSGGSKTEGVARTLLIRKELLEIYGNPVMCASFCKLIRLVDNSLSQYMYNTLQYLRLSGKTSEFDKKSASSIVNYRWKDFLSQQDVLIPPLTIIEAYNRLAECYYYKIINQSKMIECLKNARDRLLPKLMSGEIEV